MRTFLRLFPIVAVVLGISGIPAIAAEKKDPEELFKKLDFNGDGKLSLDEYVGKKKDANADKAKDRFAKLDSNGDGALTLEEFKGKKTK